MTEKQTNIKQEETDVSEIQYQEEADDSENQYQKENISSDLKGAKTEIVVIRFKKKTSLETHIACFNEGKKFDNKSVLREAKQLIKSEITDVSENHYQEETDVSENQYQKETDVSGNDFVEQNIGLFINEVVSFNTNQTDKTNDSFEQWVNSTEIEKLGMKNEKSIIKKTESLQPLSTEEKINLSSTESINDSGLSHQSPFERPKMSYYKLILEALNNASNGMLVLSDIYEAISTKYPYYKMTNKNWQNSIRYNLSLNKTFTKAEKMIGPDVEKRGCFWKLANEEIRQFERDVCQELSSSKQNLKEHKNNIHLKKEKHKNKNTFCTKCNKTFTVAKSLQRHIESVHEGKRPFKCDHCELRFSEKRNVKKHISAVHEKQKPFNCGSCDSKFATKTTLKLHTDVVHEGKKPYGCIECEAKFATRNKLETHHSAVHGGIKPYSCSHCDMKFALKYRVKEHIERIHEGKKPFQCLTCTARFFKDHVMREHIRVVHEGIKPFKCPNCTFATASKNKLKKHVDSVHEGKRPFECEICNGRFAEERNLKRHIEAVHEEKRHTSVIFVGQCFQ